MRQDERRISVPRTIFRAILIASIASGISSVHSHNTPVRSSGSPSRSSWSPARSSRSPSRSSWSPARSSGSPSRSVKHINIVSTTIEMEDDEGRWNGNTGASRTRGRSGAGGSGGHGGVDGLRGKFFNTADRNSYSKSPVAKSVQSYSNTNAKRKKSEGRGAWGIDGDDGDEDVEDDDDENDDEADDADDDDEDDMSFMNYKDRSSPHHPSCDCNKCGGGSGGGIWGWLSYPEVEDFASLDDIMDESYGGTASRDRRLKTEYDPDHDNRHFKISNVGRPGVGYTKVKGGFGDEDLFGHGLNFAISPWSLHGNQDIFDENVIEKIQDLVDNPEDFTVTFQCMPKIGKYLCKIRCIERSEGLTGTCESGFCQCIFKEQNEIKEHWNKRWYDAIHGFETDCATKSKHCKRFCKALTYDKSFTGLCTNNFCTCVTYPNNPEKKNACTKAIKKLKEMEGYAHSLMGAMAPKSQVPPGSSKEEKLNAATDNIMEHLHASKKIEGCSAKDIESLRGIIHNLSQILTNAKTNGKILSHATEVSSSGNRSPTTRPLGNRSPTAPFGGTRSPTAPFGGTRSPTAPLGGTRSPTAPFGGTRSPTAPFEGTRSPTAPLGGTRSPTAPLGGTRSPMAPSPTTRSHISQHLSPAARSRPINSPTASPKAHSSTSRPLTITSPTAYRTSRDWASNRSPATLRTVHNGQTPPPSPRSSSPTKHSRSSVSGIQAGSRH